jgi:hypothetical protein
MSEIKRGHDGLGMQLGRKKSIEHWWRILSERHHFELRGGCGNRIKNRPAAAELFHEDGQDEDSPKNSSTTAYCS